jgi:hypothetical protein
MHSVSGAVAPADEGGVEQMAEHVGDGRDVDAGA